MKRYQLIMALFASFLLLAEGVQARITMPSFFSDGMVLQQKSAVAIWGSSDRKQQKVTVKTSGMLRNIRQLPMNRVTGK